MKKKILKLVIADDHPAFLIGIEQVLSVIENISIIGKAKNTDELIKMLNTQTCDILVTDYLMPGGKFSDGLSLLTFLKRNHPNVKIIVLTMIDSAVILRPLIELGISCIISKADEPSHLIPAVHVAAAEGNYYSPSIVPISNAFNEGLRGVSKVQALSPKEIEIIRLYASGITVTDIALKLNKTKQTISTQKASAMKKLGIEQDLDIYKYAIQNGLIN